MTDHSSEALGQKKPAQFVGGQRLFLWLGVVLLGVALWLTWLTGNSPEPVYEGKPLSYWLARNPEAYPSSIATDPNAVPILIAALKDRNESWLSLEYEALWPKLPPWIRRHLRPPVNPLDLERERESAATVLGSMAALTRPAIPGLIAAFNDSYFDVRGAAVRSLGRLGQADPAVAKTLATALQDKNAETRFFAALALRRLGQRDETVMRELTAPLKNPDPEVRAARARALAFIEQLDQHVIAALVAASEDDDALVRRDATLSLGALGRVGEAETVAKALTARLKDQDTLTQRIATEGLGELGRADPAAIASLRAILLDDDAGRTRVIAAQALVQLGQQDDTLITFLIASLKADDPFVRSYAAAACGRLQPSDETVIAALEGTLNDGFIPLRFAASESLRRLGRGDADLIRALTDALNSPMDKVRTVAAGYLLHWVGNADHRAAVIRALREEEDPALRAQAAGILSQLGEPDRAAMAALGEAANDKNATVREAATNALMKIAPETAARAAVKPPPP